MKHTYVLVHGSWHGGWCWTAVAKHLVEQGHKVYAPTLTGHGLDVERVGVTHQDCVDSLVQYIEKRDLRNIILVGHSWGGNMLCGAAPRIADRLQRIIFWSAFVLDDGESILDALPPDYVALFKHLADSSPDYTVSLPWEVWRGAFMQDSGEEAARLAFSLLSPEPMHLLKPVLIKFHLAYYPSNPVWNGVLPKGRAHLEKGPGDNAARNVLRQQCDTYGSPRRRADR